MMYDMNAGLAEAMQQSMNDRAFETHDTQIRALNEMIEQQNERIAVLEAHCEGQEHENEALHQRLAAVESLLLDSVRTIERLAKGVTPLLAERQVRQSSIIMPGRSN